MSQANPHQKYRIPPSWKNPAGTVEIEDKPERTEKHSGKIIEFPDYQI